uniref:Uncharacterized protein n=1 Tax=Globodera pallida TaxID=36090 RepID=A0A183BWB7_GLOPA
MPNLFLITFGLIALFPALFVLSSAFECRESAAAAIDVRDVAKKDEKVPIRLQKLRLLSLDVNKRPFCDAEGRSAIQLPGFLHILSGELHLLQALPFPLLKENGTSLRLALTLEQNSVWVGRICDRGRSQSAFLSDQFCTLSLCSVLPEVCESLEAMAFKFAGGAFPMPIPLEPALQFPLLEGFWKAEAEIQLQLSADGEEWWAKLKRAKDGTGAEVLCSNNGSSRQVLPMPNTPLPGSIIGFQSITIRYIDQSVVTFLRNIRRLFTLGICLELPSLYTEDQSWRIMAQQIWPLLKDSVCTLVNMKKNHFAMMRKYISPTVLFDCANLRRIYSYMFPHCPTDTDSADALPAARDLYAWLHVTRSDDCPAVLTLYKWKPKWQPMLNSLTKTFSEACIGVNFIILCTFPFVYDAQFNLVNELTDERMALAARSVADGTDAVLMRFPIGIEVDTWAAYANEPLTNYVHIDFGDADIGPLPSSSHPMKAADGNRPESEVKI